jgi:hypothetical protein
LPGAAARDPQRPGCASLGPADAVARHRRDGRRERRLWGGVRAAGGADFGVARGGVHRRGGDGDAARPPRPWASAGHGRARCARGCGAGGPRRSTGIAMLKVTPPSLTGFSADSYHKAVMPVSSIRGQIVHAPCPLLGRVKPVQRPLGHVEPRAELVGTDPPSLEPHWAQLFERPDR